MSRSRGAMLSHKLLLAAVLNLALCHAGPVGPLPNVTSADLGFKEGSCSLGQKVYLAGEEMPGAEPCERCACSAGEPRCARLRCEMRAGCKAVHRPDHCCPTYQCDCEQEGRVYANGEKLVDPNDPCRVCYCQGGEVVCRRIACFVRDDCRPRLVPGRCCPEYDNCPLRGVTSLPGVTSLIPSVSSIEENSLSSAPAQSKEPMKQEITIKEITPVSEIPIKTEVKIKEIITTSDVENIEYSSSKSPLIPREATSERVSDADSVTSPNPPDTKPSASFDPSATDLSTLLVSTDSKSISEPLSKISLPMKNNFDSDVYSSKIPNFVALMGVPNTLPTPLTTKAPIIEDEEAPLDNPAFPPIPDDLSVMGNHEDDQNIDNDQPNEHEIVNITHIPVTTVAPVFKEPLSSSISPESSPVSTERFVTTSDASVIKDLLVSTQSETVNESTMLDLRSVIPKEILDSPSLISNETTGELLDATDSSVKETSGETGSTETGYLKNNPTEAEMVTYEPISSSEIGTILTDKIQETAENVRQSNVKDDIPSSTSKVGEITAETEFSSIPIETSDQNPQGIIDKDESDNVFLSTTDPPIFPSLPTKHTPDSEMITLLTEIPKGDRSYEYVETTEFFVTPYDPNDSATEPVELIKISPTGEESLSIVLRPKAEKNNVLNDLINLVGDVASMPDHTVKPDADYQTSSPLSGLNSNSEELILVNAGYKSKNNNWNLNSITEMPFKTKNSATGTKQRVVEIEDDESDNITDSPPPNDKMEPTTRRPIIDNVSDENSDNKTERSNKKDIEIINKSYVPTINKWPTKVILKQENNTSASAEFTASTANTSPESSTSFVDTTIAPNLDETTITERIDQSTEHTSTVSQ